MRLFEGMIPGLAETRDAGGRRTVDFEDDVLTVRGEGEADEEVQPHCLSHPHHHRLLGLLRHQG